jgi:hypothetical protein
MTATEFQRIPKTQLQELPSFIQRTTQQMAMEEDKFYRQIMNQVLGREPELDDAKEFLLTSHINHPGKELIAFKGVVLGRITKGWKYDTIVNAFTWTFEPGVTSFV